MKKHLTILVFGLLVLPSLVFAAYNDATLQPSVILSVGGTSLVVSSVNSVIESITVDSGSFAATLVPNSTLYVTNSAGKTLSATTATGINITTECSGGASGISIQNQGGTASASITVTPGSSSCSTSSSGGGNGGVVASSGGGGGGGAAPAAPKATSANSSGQPAFVIPLPVGPTARSVESSMVGVKTLTLPLVMGTKSTQVVSLKQILNSDPDTRISLTGPGSPGRETNLVGALTVKAIQKFQLKYGIAKKGSTGFGVVGPATRAKLNEIAKGGATTVISNPSVAPAPSTAPVAQSQQLKQLLEQIVKLQAQLKAQSSQ